MKFVKFDKSFLVIDKEFENEKILTCEHMICDLGDVCFTECQDCVFTDKAVSSEKLNIVEIEM